MTRLAHCCRGMGMPQERALLRDATKLEDGGDLYADQVRGAEARRCGRGSPGVVSWG